MASHFQLSTARDPRLFCAAIAMARTKSNGTNTSTATIGFEASWPVQGDFAVGTLRHEFQNNFKPRTSNLEIRNGPRFNDSDCFRKNDDVSWHQSEQHICKL